VATIAYESSDRIFGNILKDLNILEKNEVLLNIKYCTGSIYK